MGWEGGRDSRERASKTRAANGVSISCKEEAGEMESASQGAYSRKLGNYAHTYYIHIDKLRRVFFFGKFLSLEFTIRK